MVMELVLILVPGALTYLTATGLSRKEEKDPFAKLIEFIVYAGMDMGLLWAFESWLTGKAPMAAESLYQEYLLSDFWKSMVLALLVGVLVAFLKEISMEVQVVKVREGVFHKMPPLAKRISRWVGAALCILIVVTALFGPQVSAYRTQKKVAERKEMLTAMLEGIREGAEEGLSRGTAPEDLGDLAVSKMTVRQVTEDQHWKSAVEGKKEAVYMVDGNGTVVYFSYRDKGGASTWSGPSEDIDFIASHGGWSNGNGAGWSGSAF